MASLSWTQHVLSPSVYARPSCAQPAPVPASTFFFGGHRKDNRYRAFCHLRALASQHSSALRKDFSGHINEHAGTFRKGGTACQGRRNSEFPVENNQTTRVEDSSSPSQGASRALGLQILKPSAGSRETEKEVGDLGVLASGNAAWRAVSAHALGALLVGTLLFGVSSAEATDALKTCACLLKECRVELARCIADPGCAANVACLQTCNNRPNETECQIACGDLFENAVVDQFNDCAVSKKGCVPQKKDDGSFPIPPPSALVQQFNTSDFSGKWYITSGLNKTFDTFNCQLHEFTGAVKTVTGKLAWRIPTPDGGFFTRSAVQKFVQDENQPGVLFNHGNEFLHYQDDWYILSSKIENRPDDYVFVYYRGSNDAWDGYGGAVVYTRSSTLPPSIIPELSTAARVVGLDFNKFTTTDNSCGPEPPLFARLEKKVEEEEKYIEEEVEGEEMFLVQEVKQVVDSVGKFLGDIVKGEVDFFNLGAEAFRKDEEAFLKGLGDEEKAVLDQLNMEAKDIERLFGKAIPIKKMR